MVDLDDVRRIVSCLPETAVDESGMGFAVKNRGKHKLSIATGLESYTLLPGQEQALKAGDMFITGRPGVISSVVYAPDGIPDSAVEAHLQDTREYVRTDSPEATAQTLVVFAAS